MGTETERSGVHITGQDSGWPVGGDGEPGPKKDGSGAESNPVAVETHDVGERKINRPGDQPSETAGVAGEVVTSGTVSKSETEIDYPDAAVPEGEDQTDDRGGVDRGDAGGNTGSYESRTADELQKLAADRDIEGRSSMNKGQLIAALREQS